MVSAIQSQQFQSPQLSFFDAFKLLNVACLVVKTFSSSLEDSVQNRESLFLINSKYIKHVTRSLNCVSNIGLFMINQCAALMVAHEMGHAIAADSIYRNAHPRIRFTGGEETTFSTHHGLTMIGNCLGGKNADAFVAAAGPLANVIQASIGFALYFNLSAKKPQLSKFLLASSILSISYVMVYAFSALIMDPTNYAYDFISLWKRAGIHPLISAVSSLSLSLFPAYLCHKIAQFRN